LKTLVSIIICTRDHADSLQDTLQSITQLQAPPEVQVEVVVVDNGSRDRTADVVESFRSAAMKVHYCVEPCRGQSRARNTGMAHAQGDIFLWTDDDVTPPASWIIEMITPLLSGRFNGAGGRVKMNPRLERPWMTCSHYIRLSDTRCWPDAAAYMIGANMAFTREVLRKVPAFDVELGPGQLGFRDDTLFYSQMECAGFKIAPVPTSIVEHNFEPSRLTYQSWITNAVSSGKSLAYVKYHWGHDAIGNPGMKEMLWRLFLAAYRNTHKRNAPDHEGCSRIELRAAENVSFYAEFRKLSSEPRHYDSLALIKKTADAP
jgi:glycosyltransferase involved in cell wall biosynthesis